MRTCAAKRGAARQPLVFNSARRAHFVEQSDDTRRKRSERQVLGGVIKSVFLLRWRGEFCGPVPQSEGLPDSPWCSTAPDAPLKIKEKAANGCPSGVPKGI